MLKETKPIDFMRLSKLALIMSGLLIVISIGSLIFRGLNLGVDFTGGTVMEMTYPGTVEPTEVRAELENAGYTGFTVQHFGSADRLLVRIPPQTEDKQTEANAGEHAEKKAQLSNTVNQLLVTKTPGMRMDRVEFVGPQVGEELREKGGLAMLYALVGILIYVAFRFEFRFSLGAIVALIHDVIITLGFFSITGIEFGLTVLAAILAIIGYSLNDTIVVFDRIRENFLILRKQEPGEVINGSINQTLSRTIVTSLTTLLVLVALSMLGGEAVSAFSDAMIVGIVVGTYSSIYIAGTSLIMMGVTKETLMPPEKDEVDDLADIP